MDHHSSFDHHHHDHGSPGRLAGWERWRLATSATLHCLLGCGLGEVAGVVLGLALALSMVTTMIVAVVLGFVFGFALGILPLRRAGFGWGRAFKQVLVAEGLSIAVMETAEVLVEVYTPGVMQAGLGDPRFWGGMLLALAAGFAAAFPINFLMIGYGVRHQH